MPGKFSRNKGATEERRVCRLLRDAGYEAKRNLDQYQASDGRDVTADLPLCIQCKAGQRLGVLTAWREAESSREGHEWPVVWLNWTGGPKCVMLDERHFLGLVKAGALVVPAETEVV